MKKHVDKFDLLDDISNSVIDLCEEGKFDEAGAVCQKLRDEYPEVQDGLERQGWVYEKRGNKEKALEYYLQARDFMSKNPHRHHFEWIDNKIKELENATKS